MEQKSGQSRKVRRFTLINVDQNKQKINRTNMQDKKEKGQTIQKYRRKGKKKAEL